MKLRKIIRGYTVIELTIVCGLCALIVCLVSINVSFFNGCVVRSELDRLHMVCMTLQRVAFVTHRSTTLYIDMRNNLYTYQGHVHKLPPQVRFGIIAGVKGPPSCPNADLTTPVTFKHAAITCTAQGIIHPGTLYLTDKEQKVMYALSSGIAQVSYLRKYRYAGEWQLIA